MRYILFIYSFLISAVFLPTQAQIVEKLWETDTVLDVPESVLYADTLLYVSCINGSPLEKNKAGYIAQLNTDGQVIEPKWVKGLNAPKGLGKFKSTLYVSDIDHLVAIDCKTGEIKSNILVPNARFLNDVAIDPNGVVYVSDMNDSCIYRLINHKVELFIKRAELTHVNGLYFGENGLYAGTPDVVYLIDTNKNLKPVITKTGGIDGLERIDKNRMVISDWSGKVQIVNTNGHHVELLNFSNPKYNAADIGFNKVQRIIYIPTFFGNSVAAYQIIE